MYTATESFPRRELFGMTSQMCRAAGSVVSHIAEGQGRLTFGEWRQMLSHARGSLYEVQAQIIACHKLKYLNDASAEHLKKHVRLTGRELTGLINWVRKREEQSKHRKNDKAQTTDN